jgi:hypothetical protein
MIGIVFFRVKQYIAIRPIKQEKKSFCNRNAKSRKMYILKWVYIYNEG